MRPIVISILLLISTSFVHAQNVTNVRVYQDGEEIVIMYDIDKRASVRVLVATGKSNQFTELRAVTGSVGKDISAGVNKQITWQPLQEQTEFVAQNVRFKVEAKPVQYYFSVSETKKVVFSPSNLQYRASTNTWRFAPHQYDYIGVANTNISSTYNGWIDLFGWSGNTGSVSWGISTSPSNSDYRGNFVDWGKSIDDGNTWYTLTYDEWHYLCYTRANARDMIGVARIQLTENEYANGLILLPDNWIIPMGITFKSYLTGEYKYSIQAYADYQTFSLSDWIELEAAGAIFLPASGNRYQKAVNKVQIYGYYWSSTPIGSDYAYCLFFNPVEVYMTYSYCRYNGFSVRLVHDCKSL